MRVLLVDNHDSYTCNLTACVEAGGRGSSEPVAEETGDDGEDNPGGRAQNRRVEIGFEAE